MLRLVDVVRVEPVEHPGEGRRTRARLRLHLKCGHATTRPNVSRTAPARAVCPHCPILGMAGPFAPLRLADGPTLLAEVDAWLATPEAAGVDLLVAGVEALGRVGRAHADRVVRLLVLAAKHPDASVRAAAAGSMAVHPYGPVFDSLLELGNDRDEGVRATADEAFDHAWGLPECLECGAECGQAAVRLPRSSNPHASWSIWPIFCSEKCAVVYALDAVQVDLDRGELHECVGAGRWVQGPRGECSRCLADDDVGRDVGVDEWFLRVWHRAQGRAHLLDPRKKTTFCNRKGRGRGWSPAPVEATVCDQCLAKATVVLAEWDAGTDPFGPTS